LKGLLKAGRVLEAHATSELKVGRKSGLAQAARKAPSLLQL
jgi:hypothetical protein